MKMMNSENSADEICDSFQALCNEIDDIKMFMDLSTFESNKTNFLNLICEMKRIITIANEIKINSETINLFKEKISIYEKNYEILKKQNFTHLQIFNQLSIKGNYFILIKNLLTVYRS
jgi:hypothetical protein